MEDKKTKDGIFYGSPKKVTIKGESGYFREYEYDSFGNSFWNPEIYTDQIYRYNENGDLVYFAIIDSGEDSEGEHERLETKDYYIYDTYNKLVESIHYRLETEFVDMYDEDDYEHNGPSTVETLYKRSLYRITYEYKYNNPHFLQRELKIDESGEQRIIAEYEYDNKLLKKTIKEKYNIKEIEEFKYDKDENCIEIVKSKDGILYSTIQFFYNNSGQMVKMVEIIFSAIGETIPKPYRTLIIEYSDFDCFGNRRQEIRYHDGIIEKCNVSYVYY